MIAPFPRTVTKANVSQPLDLGPPLLRKVPNLCACTGHRFAPPPAKLFPRMRGKKHKRLAYAEWLIGEEGTRFDPANGLES